MLDAVKQIVMSYILANVLPKMLDGIEIRTIRGQVLQFNPCRCNILYKLLYSVCMMVPYIIKKEDDLLVDITLSQLILKSHQSSWNYQLPQ